MYVGGQREEGECSEFVPLPVPSILGFIHAGDYFECSLTADGRVACAARDRDSEGQPLVSMRVQGLPVPVRELISGPSTYEGGPVVCAIGEGGDLACMGYANDGGWSVAVPVHVPPVRALAIGSDYARVLTTGGDVYDFLVAKTPPPASSCLAHANQALGREPRKLRLDEPATAITGGACVLMRSGRTVCANPGD
jgi:hypothetical protein